VITHRHEVQTPIRTSRLRDLASRETCAKSLSSRPFEFTAFAIVGGLGLWRVVRARSVAFNPDEFWHLHAAWSVWHGLIPYRDFFEHHTPWFYFLLAPLFHFYQVEINPDYAAALIFLARRLMVSFSAITVFLTFVLGRMWRGQQVAWLSAVLLSTSVILTHKTLEVRPDGLALVLWLGCLAATVRAVDGKERGYSSLEPFMLSGFLLGGALMCLLKIVAVLPGFASAMLWYLLAGAESVRKRSLRCLLQLVAFFAPILITGLYFALHNSLGAFLAHMLLNLRWKIHPVPDPILHQCIAHDAVLAVLGSIGLFRAIPRDRRFSADWLLFLSTIGTIGGVFALPTPWPQNYLLFLPLLALYAGDLLSTFADRIYTKRFAAAKSVAKAAAAAGLISLLYGAIALLSARRPPTMHILFAILLISGTALLIKFRDVGVAVLLIALSLHQIDHMYKELGSTNEPQLKRLRYLLTNTSPTDSVMDGWSGLGVFRRSAWHYPFIHGDIPLMLKQEERNQLLEGLQSGQIAPEIIVPNQAMLSISCRSQHSC